MEISVIKTQERPIKSMNNNNEEYCSYINIKNNEFTQILCLLCFTEVGVYLYDYINGIWHREVFKVVIQSVQGIRKLNPFKKEDFITP